MSFPAGAGGITPGSWGATAKNGSIPGMANRDRSTVTDALRQQVQSSPTWQAVSTNFGTAIQASQDNLMANLVQSIANVDINVLGFDIHPFGFLQDWATNLHNQAATAAANITNISTGISGTTDTTHVAPTVAGIQDGLTANSNAIAALQNAQQGSTIGGATVSNTFSTPSTGTIGAGFLLDSIPYGTWEVLSGSGAGVQHNSGESAYVKWALSTTTMQTDNHQVSIVVGNAPNSVTGSGGIVRAAADMSSFVWFAATNSQVRLGYGTQSGGTITLTPWTTPSASIAQGATVTLTASGQTYTVTCNGAVLATHTDTTPQSPVGVSNRSVGFITSTGSDWFSWYSGWFAASFNASDISPPAVIGTGWSLFRSSATSTSTSGSTGWSSFTSSTLDSEANVSSNVTVVTLGSGIVQIPVEGFYSLSVGCGFSTNAGSGTIAAGISVNRASGGGWTLTRRGQDASSNAANVAVSDTLYLKVGDQVAPAIKIITGGTIIGDTAGSNTYFDGVLVSKP